jgi:hypothetical protein
MGVGYFLVNQTRREVVWFLHIPANTKCEIAGNPVAAAITSWYLLEHAGDAIAFVSDSEDEWPFPHSTRPELNGYRECTDDVVTALIDNGILEDEGREIFDPKEPDVYMRRLRNIWMGY